MLSVRPRLSYANVISTLCLFLLLGGGAYALAGAQNATTVFACVEKQNGAVRLVQAKAHCHRGERRRSWSQQGPTGAAGPAGAPGKSFDANATLPPGQTLAGPWALAASGPSGSAETQVQFFPRLSATIPALQVEFQLTSSPFDSACPGVGRAAAGFFCVYEDAGFGMKFATASSVEGVADRGMTITYTVLSANASAYGSWALTAP